MPRSRGVSRLKDQSLPHQFNAAITQARGGDDIDDVIKKALEAQRPHFDTVQDFERYLISREYDIEEPYGQFQQGAGMVRFFADKDGGSLLQEMRDLNEKDGLGNIHVPGTSVELINYSHCPRCKTPHTYRDLLQYYLSPKPIPGVKQSVQLRRDTRMRCKECEQFFLPSLVICEESPKDEVQFLCRAQVIDEVEMFYKEEKSKSVLTKNRENFISDTTGRFAVRNDLLLTDLHSRLTLVANVLQYTPAAYTIPLILGQNRERNDPLFGVWSDLN